MRLPKWYQERQAEKAELQEARQVLAEWENRVEERQSVTDLLVELLDGANLGGERMRVALVQLNRQGPLGGLSDTISIELGNDRATSRFFRVLVYAHGVMAEPAQSNAIASGKGQHA